MLESEFKEVEINDMGRTLRFRIGLFSCEKGFLFFSKASSEEKFDPMKYLTDLIGLAVFIPEEGESIPMDNKNVFAMIRSPLAVNNLLEEIVNHQMVFTGG